MSRRRIRPNPDQLGLSLAGEGFEGALETRGVFSLAYLSRHLNSAPEFASEQDCAGDFREIAEIWQRHLTALRHPRTNESFTCSTFLEPVLDRLAWRRIPQQSMPTGFAHGFLLQRAVEPAAAAGAVAPAEVPIDKALITEPFRIRHDAQSHIAVADDGDGAHGVCSGSEALLAISRNFTAAS